jgi:putative heme-binding domain-containing protein
VDYLVESLLDPNKAIKDGYNSVVVATTDGNVQNGIKVSQDATQMILRDAINDRIVIAKANVKSERPGGSLMPTGLIDHLPDWERTNLLRFLSELGKPGPFGSGNPMLIRRWRVRPAAAADALAHDAAPLASPDRAAALPWAPAYSLVNGDLPADAMAADGQAVAFVRGEIEVTAAGRIAIRVNDVKGLSMWIDEKPTDAKGEVEADLAAGLHAITFRVELGVRAAGLRAELRDVSGSSGHARPVGGR